MPENDRQDSCRTGASLRERMTPEYRSQLSIPAGCSRMHPAEPFSCLDPLLLTGIFGCRSGLLLLLFRDYPMDVRVYPARERSRTIPEW